MCLLAQAFGLQYIFGNKSIPDYLDLDNRTIT